MFEHNRRKTPRINYSCQLTVWAAEGAYDTVLARTSNVGLGGVCVILPQDIRVRTKVELKIDFNDDSPFFLCSGQVVRCLMEKNRWFNIGIQFDALGESKQETLKNKISQLINLEGQNCNLYHF